jgi:hypothetical protein
MSVNLQAERLYDQVELVRGIGSRNRGQLCIMSFVAYLAGERHTDHPHTASPFIHDFAIPLNDGIPSAFCQDLKPFAPRIIGTKDGHDLKRAEVVSQMITGEVQPRAMVDFPYSLEDIRHELANTTLFSLAAGWGNSGPTGSSIASRFRAVRDAHEQGQCLLLATRAGQLFVALVLCAPSPAAQRWYWAKALELLDRLCDVGADHRAARIGCENVIPVSVQCGPQVLTTQPKADLQKIERRPMQKISEVFRAVRDFVSA